LPAIHIIITFLKRLNNIEKNNESGMPAKNYYILHRPLITGTWYIDAAIGECLLKVLLDEAAENKSIKTTLN